MGESPVDRNRNTSRRVRGSRKIIESPGPGGKILAHSPVQVAKRRPEVCHQLEEGLLVR